MEVETNTEIDYGDDTWNPPNDVPTISDAVRIISFVLTAITCVTGLVGNSVVIIVTGSNLKLKEHRNTIWFLAMALADFLFLLWLPLNAIAEWTGYWPFGPLLCKLNNFLLTNNMYTNIFILMALNINCLLSVTHPRWQHKLFASHACYLTCAFIWGISVLSSLPVLFLHDQFTNEDAIECRLFNMEQPRSVHVWSNPIERSEDEFLYISEAVSESPEFALDSSGIVWSDRVTDSSFNARHAAISFVLIGYLIPLLVLLSSDIIVALRKSQFKNAKSMTLYRMLIWLILVFYITWTPLVTAKIILLIVAHIPNTLLVSAIYRIKPLLYSIAQANISLKLIVYVLYAKKTTAS
ncbi:hypothetical protein GDO86_013860 [Hymenochirus boettgeri]|uniref:G-protein coupled receptors family 1 profile domain-containing protein n=1 Tax=Hymenochirus boettgeri TaxID=247094 RepID=A0A8T2JUY7_9PIPI|nr:hypothetical protein GDO86_013860 [Hymenochirus boettgeri]